MIETADVDENGYIDRDEFLNLVTKHCEELENIHKNNFQKYLRVAAYAEEYKWWPPPIFTILTIAMNISIYIYHVHHFMSIGEAITWSEPVPLCSTLIFNSEKRYEVCAIKIKEYV